jgi:hypothetical protein
MNLDKEGYNLKGQGDNLNNRQKNYYYVQKHRPRNLQLIHHFRDDRISSNNF